MNTKWKSGHTWLVVIISLAIAAIASFIWRIEIAGFVWIIAPHEAWFNIVLWWVFAILITILIVGVGNGITGNILGALIDQNNKMRLSRLQLIVWTIVILSAWLTTAVWNLGTNSADPLGIALPAEVWGLLGISTGSLVGTTLIHNRKSETATSDDKKLARLRQHLQRNGEISEIESLAAMGNLQDLRNNVTGSRSNLQQARTNFANIPTDQRMVGLTDLDNLERQYRKDSLAYSSYLDTVSRSHGLENNGRLAAHTDVSKASPADLFAGDDIENDAYVDIGKIQMFLFTLILVVAYAVDIGKVLTAAGANSAIDKFPDLDPGMLALLAISHAGYLSYKAASHPAPKDDTDNG